jgi:hypothetical protein
MSQIIKQFNQKVQVLNQSGGKQLLLSAKEAKDLHYEVLNLLNRISELEVALRAINEANASQPVIADGGKFR